MYCYQNSKRIPLQIRLSTWFVIKLESSVRCKFVVFLPRVRWSSFWVKLPIFERSIDVFSLRIWESSFIVLFRTISRIKVDSVEIITRSLSSLPRLLSALQKRKIQYTIYKKQIHLQSKTYLVIKHGKLYEVSEWATQQWHGWFVVGESNKRRPGWFLSINRFRFASYINQLLNMRGNGKHCSI